MIFTEAITTPANTAQGSALSTKIPVVAGTIDHVFIFFPPGVNALAHLTLLYGLYQIFPSNQDADFAAGGVLIDWPEDTVIDREPYELTAVTWNEDDTYEHTITVHVSMTPSNVAPNAQQTIAQLLAPAGG